MAFQLDTTGSIGIVTAAPQGGSYCQTLRWKNLTPFTQGYIEALFTWGRENIDLETARWRDNVGFSDLAPETLAHIIADTDVARQRYPESLPWQGQQWFMHRQAGQVVWAPPLTVQLGDDGKVRFA